MKSIDNRMIDRGTIEPGYIRLNKSGELAGRIEASGDILKDCTLFAAELSSQGCALYFPL